METKKIEKIISMGNIDTWGDEGIESEIRRVCNAIESWATLHDLWFDCGFKSHIEHVDGEPRELPVITILWSEGALRDVIFGEDYSGLEPEFRNILDELGYWYECLDNVTAAIYPNDDNILLEKFLNYFHWQWICSLVKEDTADVYEELYSHFATRPGDLSRLSWREFEVLLFRIFQNQGYKALLGPGRNDGGIDIRLWQVDPIGDVLTVVQVKQKLPHNKIDLTDVAALYGVGHIENAQKALFVTTSSYAPVARKFAARTSGVLELAEKKEIITWCDSATKGILTDKSKLISETNLMKIVDQLNRRLDSRIVHAEWGYDTIRNKFAIVIKETKYAALLVGLESQTISHDGYGQRGLQIPFIDPSSVPLLLNPDNVWRAKRKIYDNCVSYWDGRDFYTPWTGKPMHFDYMD